MDTNSKKLLIISLLPAFLALLFIMLVVFPAISNLNEIKQNLKTEKDASAEFKEKISALQEKNVDLKRVQQLQIDLKDFDARFPLKDDTEIVLYDFQKIAGATGTKITEWKANKDLQTIDINENELKNKKTSQQSDESKPRKRKNTQEGTTLKMSTISVTLNVVGFYDNILNFMEKIENYQRKALIEDISVENYKKIPGINHTPVEMIVSFKIFKQNLQEVIPVNSTENNTAETEDTKGKDSKTDTNSSQEG